MNVLVINQGNTPWHIQLPQFICCTFGENWFWRQKAASTMARQTPSFALRAASEDLLVTTKGLSDYSVSVSTPQGLARTHNTLKAVLTIQSCKTLPAPSEAHHGKIDCFETSTNLQKNRFDTQNIKTKGISKYQRKRSLVIFHMKHCTTPYNAPLRHVIVILFRSSDG